MRKEGNTLKYFPDFNQQDTRSIGVGTGPLLTKSIQYYAKNPKAWPEQFRYGL